MIDIYFSSVLMQVGLFILLAVLVVMLFYVSPVCDRFDSFLQRASLFRFRKFLLGAAFAVMLVPLLLPVLNAQYWAFGPVTVFKEAGQAGGRLYAIDELGFGGGKFGPPRRRLRLHIIDRASGRRISRQSVAAGSAGYRGPMVFCAPGEQLLLVTADDGVSAYDSSTGRKKYSITKDSLPVLVAGFAGTVSSFNFSGRSSMLDILTSDGYHVLVNPFNLTIRNKISERYANPGALRLEKPGDATGSSFIMSAGPRRKLMSVHGLSVESKEVFLDGYILQAAPGGRLAVIASYPDMDRNGLLLSCYSSEGKQLWRKDKREFTTAESPAISFSAILGNDLILLIDGHISSININSGRLNWERRY